jgi:hypothetical protein
VGPVVAYRASAGTNATATVGKPPWVNVTLNLHAGMNHSGLVREESCQWPQHHNREAMLNPGLGDVSPDTSLVLHAA